MAVMGPVGRTPSGQKTDKNLGATLGRTLGATLGRTGAAVVMATAVS